MNERVPDFKHLLEDTQWSHVCFLGFPNMTSDLVDIRYLYFFFKNLLHRFIVTYTYYRRVCTRVVYETL